MSDTISRQAAIDAVIEWYGCKPDDIEALEEIIKAMPSAQPEQQWIPCSERLPQESDLVIICSEFGGIEFGSYEEGKWYWLAESCSYYLEESIDEVVAWMPMPEKYREDSK